MVDKFFKIYTVEDCELHTNDIYAQYDTEKNWERDNYNLSKW